MKKLIALALSLSICLSFSSCSINENAVFDENIYTEINIKEEERALEALASKMSLCDKAPEAIRLYDLWEKEILKISDNATYIELMFNLDTSNEESAKNKKLYDGFIPRVSALDNKIIGYMLNLAPAELENRIGKGRLEDVKAVLSLSSRDISSLEARESELCMEFDILEVRAREEINKSFSKIAKTLSKARGNTLTNKDITYCFYKAKNDFYKENKLEYERILLELIKTRKEIAGQCGMDSYADFCYTINNRSYKKEDIESFRSNIKNYISPVYEALCDRKKEEMGLNELCFYIPLIDYNPPCLKVNDAKLISKILESNISRETKKCLKAMDKGGFMDIDSSKNKAGGAFTTVFQKARMPFIFASNSQTLDFVNTFIHELGHSFSFYNARNKPYLFDRSLDISEIHSHSMEILSLNFYDKILKSDPNEAIALYMENLLDLILLSAMNDEFQQIIYESEIRSIDDANKIYKELYEEYFYDFDYDGLDYFEEGGIYSAISHIYTRPFYMIDYTLAILVSLNLYYLQEQSYDDALSLYMDIINTSKDLSFCEVLEKNNIPNPIFDYRAIEKAGNTFKNILLA